MLGDKQSATLQAERGKTEAHWYCHITSLMYGFAPGSPARSGCSPFAHGDWSPESELTCRAELPSANDWVRQLQ